MLSKFSQFIFGGSSLFGARETGQSVSTWRDKSLCFDLRSSDIELNVAERLIACFFPIEDIKGNPDELGVLKITNLRLIWISCDKKRVNLSIGWRTVTLIFEQNLKDSFGANINTFCVLTKFDSTKYEFVFNKMSAYSDLWNGSDNFLALAQLRKYRNVKSLALTHLTPSFLEDPFDVVLKVWQAYKRTQLFRHCRANLSHLLPADSPTSHSSLKLGDFNKLSNEDVVDVYTNVVQSESRTNRFNGLLILTNIRIIWIDDALPMRNLSIPYIRIEGLKLKQGDKILIHTHDYLATSNQIELRVVKSTDVITTKLLFEQIQNLYEVYRAKPKYGPESCDECINFMNHLRPLDNFFNSLDESGNSNMEDFGPALLVDTYLRTTNEVEKKESEATMIDESKVDVNERDLVEYSAKLTSYLNEQPINRDCKLIYHTAFGLAVERPENNVNLERIWRFNL